MILDSFGTLPEQVRPGAVHPRGWLAAILRAMGVGR